MGLMQTESKEVQPDGLRLFFCCHFSGTPYAAGPGRPVTAPAVLPRLRRGALRCAQHGAPRPQPYVSLQTKRTPSREMRGRPFAVHQFFVVANVSESGTPALRQTFSGKICTVYRLPGCRFSKVCDSVCGIGSK